MCNHTGPLLLCPMIAKIRSLCYLSFVCTVFQILPQLVPCLGVEVPLVPCLVHAAGEGEKGDPCNNLPREEDGGDLLMQALCLDEKYKQVIIEKHTNVHHCNCLIITKLENNLLREVDADGGDLQMCLCAKIMLIKC